MQGFIDKKLVDLSDSILPHLAAWGYAEVRNLALR